MGRLRILAATTALAGGAVATVLAGGGGAAPIRVSEFRADCTFSHRALDDPIVLPGRPGASHSHDFFGARTTDAHTTYASLRRSPTSCRPDADRSAYWMPTVIAEGRQAPIRIVETSFYYVSRHVDPTAVRPHPPGLRMIAGDARAARPQAEKRAFWSCRGAGSQSVQRIPACPRGSRLELHLDFPDCWDGRRADSRDHRSHVAYSSAGRCPRAHPVQIPQVQVKATYATRGGPSVAMSSGAGHTAHGDFFDGWDRRALRLRVDRCLRARLKCDAAGRVVDG